MKRLLILMCLNVIMATNVGLRAQQVTITLNPGYTWICCPTTDTLDIVTALGSFTPMQGDVIKSKNGYMAAYAGGRWIGRLSQFYPGYGYHYFSNRTEPISLTLGVPLPQVTITTEEPTDITSVSAVVGGTVTLDACNHIFARGVCWGTESNPNIDGAHLAGDTVEGSQSITLTGLTPNTAYYVRAYTVTDCGLAYGDSQSFTTLEMGNEHEYVDLGLPSGLLWATCNVGADTPEEYGDYFAWGETQPKDIYDWITYQHCNGGYHLLTKYCYNVDYGNNGFTDNLTVLLSEDDAATGNWSDAWRMPTKEEWQELYQNTTNIWTQRNGVNGWLFTASNGNSLFMPAVGFKESGSLFSAGSEGSYWSSTLSDHLPDVAWSFCFDEDGSYFTESGREKGKPVRPVRFAPQNNAPTGAINGKFSVSATQQVYFSQGNLQYQASTDTWRFAENQYDVVGGDNVNISEVYDGWIDLFCWGTSGWDNGNVYYHPWDWDNSNSTFFGPPGEYNLTGEYANSDWGVYNPILNGGNTAGQWRTLTYTEWYYLLNTRNTISGIRYVKAQVKDVNGVILLPDDWDTDTYPLSTTNGYSSNILTDSQWSILEQAGCVLLPETSIRLATEMGDPHTGRYWTASYYNEGVADYLGFYDTGLRVYTTGYRWQGHGVRLVQDVE